MDDVVALVPVAHTVLYERQLEVAPNRDRERIRALEDHADAPAQLFTLEGEAGPEYWIGFHNFYVITRYNHSAMYALAVFQLSDALSDARSATDGSDRVSHNLP